jgi:uncharacterized protein YcfJ
MKHFVIAATIALVSTSAFANQYEKYPQDVQVRDIEKTVITSVPYTVEVCRQVPIYGQGAVKDTTGDMIIGGIIGGVIGNQIGKGKGNKVATGVGAMTGAIIANNKAQQNNQVITGYQNVCGTETRYKEQEQTVYSHSVATFYHEGRKYSVQFVK